MQVVNGKYENWKLCSYLAILYLLFSFKPLQLKKKMDKFRKNENITINKERDMCKTENAPK